MGIDYEIGFPSFWLMGLWWWMWFKARNLTTIDRWEEDWKRWLDRFNEHQKKFPEIWDMWNMWEMEWMKQFHPSFIRGYEERKKEFFSFHQTMNDELLYTKARWSRSPTLEMVFAEYNYLNRHFNTVSHQSTLFHNRENIASYQFKEQLMIHMDNKHREFLQKVNEVSDEEHVAVDALLNLHET